MSRRTATLLGLAAIGLALASFVLLGFGRLLLGYRAALALAAPPGTVAFVLAVALFVGFALAGLGLGPLAEDD